MRFNNAYLFVLSLCIVCTSTFCFAENDRTSDIWLESKILTTYTLNSNLNPFEIDADVVDGKVILNGVVDEAIDKDLAEEIARSVEGVTAVENNIEVVKEATLAPRSSEQKNSFGTMVSDATITASVKSKLLWNRHTSGNEVDVATDNGNVSLSGQVDNDQISDLAEQLALNTSGVKYVDNDLEVEENNAKARLGNVDLDKVSKNAKDIAGQVGRKVSDTWISTKIQTTFALTRGLYSSDISVDVKEGVVTLSGSTVSISDKNAAEELAEGMRGVRKVVNNIAVRS